MVISVMHCTVYYTVVPFVYSAYCKQWYFLLVYPELLPNTVQYQPIYCTLKVTNSSQQEEGVRGVVGLQQAQTIGWKRMNGNYPLGLGDLVEIYPPPKKKKG